MARKVVTFKIGDMWSFRVGVHTQRGYATKDEAALAGEKYLVEVKKAEAKKRKEAAKKKKKEEEDD